MSTPVRHSSSRRAARQRTWVADGVVVEGWGGELLGWALAGLGLSIVVVHVIPDVLPTPTAPAATQSLVWLALAVPVLLGLRRERPRGLLAVRSIDVAAGLLLGILLRLADGAIEGIGGVPAAWPALVTSDGALPGDFWAQAAAGTLVTPVVEELFFRGVVLVGLVLVLRPLAGPRPAAVAAVAASATLFAVAHALAAARSGADLLTLALLGLVAGVLTMSTGRIAPAVVMHLVFNATGFALLVVGTLLA
ncbi:CPBP family glutamic-type intramembrane protease [uncultured Microbacterium sp.]|uniref:CPBP family glutamic-type intramembrane protease n=1 Tax=uncultured Microbacterium sp. TaxID=191216 RepID=UPI0026004544|nr:CPBP family glutamic-type intramembrane protease [uncultured Microbacterium sp.]